VAARTSVTLADLSNNETTKVIERLWWQVGACATTVGDRPSIDRHICSLQHMILVLDFQNLV